MADGEWIGSFQTMDYALGARLVECFSGLASAGPKSYKRFVEREGKEKIYLANNGDVQTILRKIAGDKNDTSEIPELPLVIYWRQNGLIKDDLQYTQVIEAVRFKEETGTTAMQLTLIPFAFTYDILLLAWDRETLEHMGMAYMAFFAPLGRKRSRFLVPMEIDGEIFEIGASLSTPRDLATSSEGIGDARLFATRISTDLRCQGVYGKKIEVPEYVRVVGHGELLI